MEKSKITSWLMAKTGMFIWNLLCLLNVTLWLFVLYFSMHEDKIAAVLSYMAVMLSVILVKYGFRDIKINETFTCIIKILSITLVLAGVFLVLLSKFWNTAFYSICLGIIVRKLKYEVDSTSVNVCSFLNANAIHEDRTFDNTCNKREDNFQVRNIVRRKIEDNLQDQNKNENLVYKNEEFANDISRIPEAVKDHEETHNEIRSSDKINKSLSKCENSNDYEEKHEPYFQEIQEDNLEEYYKRKIMLHTEIRENINENTENMSAIEQTEKILEQKSDSENADIENKILKVTSLNTLETFTLNEQKLELDKCCEALSSSKLDETANKRDFKRYEDSDDIFEKFVSNDERKLSKDPDKLWASIEFITANAVDNMLSDFPGDIRDIFSYSSRNLAFNVLSNESSNKEKSSSNFDKQNCLHNRSEIKKNSETVHIFKDAVNSLNSDISDLEENISENKQNCGRVNIYVATEQEKNFFNKCDLQREPLSQFIGDSDAKNKCEKMNCITENINIQPEVTFEYPKHYKSENNFDENLKTVSEEQDFRSIETVDSLDYYDINYLISFNENNPSDNNELVFNDGTRNEIKERVKSKEKGVSEVSNVEDVVNKIDLSFIYGSFT